MTVATSGDRMARFHAKTLEKQQAETAAVLAALEARGDYRPAFAYFIDLFRGGTSLPDVARRVGKLAAGVLCVQAPPELFHACGIHPYKIFSGSHAAGQVAAPRLPALTCPMLRSALGALEREQHTDFPWVIPATCDWVVKFSEMARLDKNRVHLMELPRLKDTQRGRERWFSEVAALGDFLGRLGGRAPNRKSLLESIAVFKTARQCFGRLVAMRRAGLVPGPWFFLIANAFFLDTVENWTSAVENALPCFKQTAPEGERIFLAGSPVFFPNFKLPHLLEEAGLLPVGDDLCSSERIFPENVAVGDPSKEGLLRALAESYHQGCLCPVFGDNERRINNINGALADARFKGIVFHVLKGCHPYDLESFSMEAPLKDAGLRFLRVETDYSGEDSQNIVTRLEAFRNTLKEVKP